MDADSFAKIIDMLMRQKPFRPFVIEMQDRSKLPVDAPEALVIADSGLVTRRTATGRSMFDSTSVVCVTIDPPARRGDDGLPAPDAVVGPT